MPDSDAAWFRFLYRFTLPEEAAMLRWALIFLIVALVAAVFGFGGVAGDAAWIAKILFFVFLVVFVVSLIMGRAGKTLS
jgi:uncharacterized membrane protein YtjA (UPF0391 family)